MRLRLPQAPGPRRRLLALLVAAFTALVTGTEIGARSDDVGSVPPASSAEEQERDLTADMTLRQIAGQLVVLSFDGTEPPTYVEDALRAGEAAGAILFADNIFDETQLRSLTRSLQRAGGGSALIAVDQEGGVIRIVPFAAPEPAAGEVSRPREAEALGRRTGRDLTRLGINVNLAPVADVVSVPGSVMAGRAYPGDADQVSALVVAAIRGLERGGVAATAKHFPGIGAATANTDDAEVTIERSRRRLERIDLPPFRAALDADAPLVMASHALYPALDRRQIASQSQPVLVELLREELGYDGVIVTDSLEAEAVLSRSTTPSAAVASIDGGADLLLTTSSGSYMPVVDRLVAAARRSDRFRARLEESATRVFELKERMGLKPPPRR